MAACVSCGAPSVGDEHSFVCGFCGCQNTSDEYFRASAAEALRRDLSGSRSLALSAFESGDYESASQLFKNEIAVVGNDAESWKYYALSRVAIINASNFESECRFLRECLLRLPEDVRTIIGSQISRATLDIAAVKVDDYYRRALVRFENEVDPSREVQKGLEILVAALDLPNYASIARVHCLCIGMSILLSLQDWGISGPYAEALGDRIRDELGEISEQGFNADTVGAVVDACSSRHPRLIASLIEYFPELRSLSMDGGPAESSGWGWLVVLTLAVLLTIYLLS